MRQECEPPIAPPALTPPSRFGRWLHGLAAIGLLFAALTSMGCTSNPTPYPGHGDTRFGADDAFVAEPPGTDDGDAKVGAIEDGDDAIDPAHGASDAGIEGRDDGDASDAGPGGDDVRILVDDVGGDHDPDEGDDDSDDDDGFDFHAPSAERVDGPF